MVEVSAKKRATPLPAGSRRSSTPNLALGASVKRKPTTATTNTNITRNGLENDNWPSTPSSKASSQTGPTPATPTPSQDASGSYFSASRARTPALKKGLDIKNKPRRALREEHARITEEDNALEKSEAFKFLYKLFVPNKYVIKNNRVSVKHLLNHLPSIIPTSSTSQDVNTYVDLNLQIHLFLGTIMVNYVNSWYFGKLNTDNIEFVQLVYSLICDLIRDMSNRINVLLKNESSVISLLDQISEILNQHLSDLVCDSPSDPYDIKVLNDYYNVSYSRNTLKNQAKNPEQLLSDFLSERHLIFDETIVTTQDDLQSHVEDGNDDDYIFANETLDQIEEEENRFRSESPTSDNNKLIYFRILIRKLLVTTFDSGNDAYATGPLNSKISMDLIILLLGDLVLNKVFQKLASPEFILNTIVKSAVEAVDKTLSQTISEKTRKQTAIPASSYTQSFKISVKTLFANAYGGLTYLILNFSSANFVPSFVNSNENDTEQTKDIGDSSIFENSILKLLNTITNLSKRKPLLFSLFTFSRNYITIHASLTTRLDSFFSRYISNRVMKSRFLSDDYLCQIVNDLRKNLFEDNGKQDTKDEDNHIVTVEDLVENIFVILTEKFPRVLPSVFNHANLFKYQNETDEELRSSIRKLLIIFNYKPTAIDDSRESLDASSNNVLNESCELNKLLVINLLDCVVGNLYPEI